jgi:DNA-binding HxlR family transcriptional regulator
MRGALRMLTGIGVLQRSERGDAQGTVDYRLAPPGVQLLKVAEALKAWLAASPQGRLELGTPPAGAAVKALIDGWAVSIVRVLASRPLAPSDLGRLITALGPADLERCLAAMRRAGLLEASGEGPAALHAPTEWLRRAVGPLAAGAYWERRYLPAKTPPISRHDVEAAFLLSVPLLRLRPERSGRCRLAVELLDSSGDPAPVGVVVEVRDGQIVSCVARLGGEAGAWALGRPSAWLAAVIEGDAAGLKLGGDVDLATDIAWGLHDVLAERFTVS